MRSLYICALTLLAGCSGQPQVVFKDRLISVPVPVQAEIDSILTADCAPTYEIGLTEKVTVDASLRRLESVEDALYLCRLQLEKLRQAGAAQKE